MSKYVVVFEFLNKLGEWVTDSMSNNGIGFTREEAEHVLNQLKCDEVCTKKNLKIKSL